MGKQGSIIACERFRDALDEVLLGKPLQDYEKILEKAVMTYRSCCKGPEVYSEHDATNKALKRVETYYHLKATRKRVMVHGTEREIAPETEILESLRLSQWIMGNIVTPYLSRDSPVISELVHDHKNLSLGYLSSIIQSSAEGFIASEEIIPAKERAVEVSRRAMRLDKQLQESKGSIQDYCAQFTNEMKGIMGYIRSNQLRPFESAFTRPKKINYFEECTQEVIRKIIEEGYFPQVIFPIAHGGLETGINIDLALRAEGHEPYTYPLLFSMKTRRQKEPELKGDEKILASIRDKEVLISEDWITTGDTVRGINAELEKGLPKDLRIATLKQDPSSKTLPLIRRLDIYSGMESKYLGNKKGE